MNQSVQVGKKRLTSAAGDAEAKSGLEIVAVWTPRAVEHPEPIQAVAVLMAIAVVGVMVAVPWTVGLVMALVVLALALWIGMAWARRSRRLTRWLVPRPLRRLRVSEKARASFVRNGESGHG